VREEKLLQHNESMFRRNFWDFARKCCRGTLVVDDCDPKFSVQTMESFMHEHYGAARVLDFKQLSWVDQVDPIPYISEPFKTGPVRPRDVKMFLKSRSSSSAPGPDGLTYAILKHLPCVHGLLSTLFSRLREEDEPHPPQCWTRSVSILIFKKGERDDPGNFRRIVLSNVIGKMFNALLAKDLTVFVLKNKIIDPTFQKAFLEGVSGCVEHTMVLHEVIQNARATKRTVHVTSLDLKDAFGSVAPQLIRFTLNRAGVPTWVRQYIDYFLRHVETRVRVGDQYTDFCSVRNGTNQGDPVSSILFLLAINLVLKYLESEKKYDFEFKHSGKQIFEGLPGVRIVSLPFADDFGLSTTNLRTHQRILNSTHEKLVSLGFELNPRKCVSLSISRGTFKPVKFFIGPVSIPTADVVGFKSLGSHFFPSGKSSKTEEMLKGVISKILERIDLTRIRGEMKIRIYDEYVLPSLRFLLGVHELPKSRVQNLHTLCHRFVKKWSGLPRPATEAVLYHNGVFGLKSLPEEYVAEHTSNYVRMRFKGDAKVNTILDYKLAREKDDKRSVTTTVEADQILRRVESEVKLQSVDAAQVRAREIVGEKFREKLETRLEKLTVQGKFLEIVRIQNGDGIWKSIMYELPQPQLSFLFKAGIDAAPSNANIALNRVNCVVVTRLSYIFSTIAIFLSTSENTRGDMILYCGIS